MTFKEIFLAAAARLCRFITGGATMPPTANPQPEDLKDIQGNLFRGYNMKFAKYLFYRWETPQQGRDWIKTLLPDITTSEPWPNGNKPASALNVAFTHGGLKTLGLSPNALASFPDEFKQGMAARAALLGDFGNNDPAKWDKLLGSTNVHALVIIHATSDDIRRKVADDLEKRREKIEGVKLMFEEEGEGFDDHKEHFGFKDGISQPLIENADKLLGAKDSPPGGGKRTQAGDWAPLKAGEFILGYEDESGRVASLLNPIPTAISDPDPTSLLLPSPEGLWKNGTFLVFRKLEQDVAGFRSYLMEAAAKVFGSAGQANADRLGALMMGRWPSGCPVDLSANTDDTSIGNDELRNNNFSFEKDPKDPKDPPGGRCPLGAHIRRTNPRESPDPDPQNPIPNDPALGSNRHRLIRRGMPYGPKFDEKGNKEEKEKKRGLFFIALNASIARQFEFLQGFWVNSGEFQGLDRTDRDPIIGGNRDERDVLPKAMYEVQRGILGKTLNDKDIKGKVTGVHPGPVAAKYEYEMAPGSQLGNIDDLAKVLAQALKVASVRIEAPPSGKSVVGIEVPTHPEVPRKFTVPAGTKMPMAFNLPEFVTTRGGDYFFVPSKPALENLVKATVAYPSFRYEYGMLEKQISDPGRLALARLNLVTKWLVERAKMMFDELRAETPPVFTMPGYPAMRVPTVVIATKADDVRAILHENEVFTVAKYSEKMVKPKGPFILGMPDTRDPDPKKKAE
ncbi:MAG: Dyp-type peroxidase, partial [candidate division NC10 bacterium]|nr:Dyp-type peroxidase [candidate division NC10 bacterium]